MGVFKTAEKTAEEDRLAFTPVLRRAGQTQANAERLAFALLGEIVRTSEPLLRAEGKPLPPNSILKQYAQV